MSGVTSLLEFKYSTALYWDLKRIEYNSTITDKASKYTEAYRNFEKDTPLVQRVLNQETTFFEVADTFTKPIRGANTLIPSYVDEESEHLRKDLMKTLGYVLNDTEAEFGNPLLMGTATTYASLKLGKYLEPEMSRRRALTFIGVGLLIGTVFPGMFSALRNSEAQTALERAQFCDDIASKYLLS